MNVLEIVEQVGNEVGAKAKIKLDLKQDKLSLMGASNRGVYVSAAGAVSAMAHTLDADVPANAAFTDTTYGAATPSAAGLMSAADKTKLDTLIDSTLSNAGQAADAKAAGDKIAALESANNQLREYIKSLNVEKTVSGNPATFPDAKAANVKELVVTLAPTQAGSGDPYPPGGGKNLLEITASSATLSGVTLTVNTDAAGNVTGVTANGTATDRAIFTLGYAPFQKGVSYILSGTPSSQGSGKSIVFVNGYEGRIPQQVDYGTGVNITPDEDYTGTIMLIVYSGVTVSNVGYFPMIRLASDTDPTFAPYSNIRPISGVSSVSVTRTGKNLWGNGDISGTAFVRGNLIKPLPPGAYKFSAIVTSSDTDNYESTVWLKNANGNVLISQYIGRSASTRKSISFTLSETATAYEFLAARSYDKSNGDTISIADAQIERGTSATAYEPYRGQSVTVSLTDGSNPLTVYGGTVDVTAGKLAVTHGNIASYNGETLPGVWISDRDVYAAGTTPTTGAQVIYKLAASVPYQLTPQQLATLSGYNAVSTDAGSASVTYRADPSIALGGD